MVSEFLVLLATYMVTVVKGLFKIFVNIHNTMYIYVWASMNRGLRSDLQFVLKT